MRSVFPDLVELDSEDTVQMLLGCILYRYNVTTIFVKKM
jgi:hypothetical protein